MKNKYKIIYADPPWQTRNKNVGGSMKSSASNHYDTMSVDDICSLNVSRLADDDCFLFMWWLASMPIEAIRVVQRWGFNLKTMTCFSWIKKTKNFKDHFGMGFYTRQQQEHCLVATRGKPVVVSHAVRQNIYGMSLEHSVKPGEVRGRIVDLAGDLPRVELFSREKIEGWDSIGNGIDGKDIRDIVGIRGRVDKKVLLKLRTQVRNGVV